MDGSARFVLRRENHLRIRGGESTMIKRCVVKPRAGRVGKRGLDLGFGDGIRLAVFIQKVEEFLRFIVHVMRVAGLSCSGKIWVKGGCGELKSKAEGKRLGMVTIQFLQELSRADPVR